MSYYKEKYTRNIEISLIVTLIFFILLFYFFAKFDPTSYHFSSGKISTIEVIHIPITTQQRNMKPRPSKPIIPVESDVIELLDYVEIEDLIRGDSSGIEIISGPVYYTDLPFTPRQLLDVLPERIDESVSGEIILSLRIGINGLVKEYKVKKNTTFCNPCLQNVINAAQQSRWEPAVMDNHKIEYWIDKIYHF